jgi:hypothetical protein
MMGSAHLKAKWFRANYTRVRAGLTKTVLLAVVYSHSVAADGGHGTNDRVGNAASF